MQESELKAIEEQHRESAQAQEKAVRLYQTNKLSDEIFILTDIVVKYKEAAGEIVPQLIAHIREQAEEIERLNTQREPVKLVTKVNPWGETYRACPDCGERIGSEAILDHPTDYCFRCGARLDWSE